MKTDKGGRPTVMTDAVLAKLESAFSIGASDVEACFHAGISPDALYYYQEKNPLYAERKKMLKEAMVLKARMVVYESLNAKDKQTAQWYLERKKKDEFSQKTENAVMGADGGALKTTTEVKISFVDSKPTDTESV